jgi:RNA polymerase sigma-70 factor (ECF subfamily)
MRRLDPELVAHLQANDISAFDALYGKYHQAVYRNIVKLTKDAIAAEDLLQEVFVRLWEKRMQLNSGQSVAGWLFVISFNLSVNYTRKILRQQTMHKKLLVDHVHSESLIGGFSLQEEQYHLLERAIEQLPPQKRKVVSLCKLEGKTYEEAAAELKISRHTVKEHLSTAMVYINNYVQKNADHAYVAVFLLWLNSYNQ